MNLKEIEDLLFDFGFEPKKASPNGDGTYTSNYIIRDTFFRNVLGSLEVESKKNKFFFKFTGFGNESFDFSYGASPFTLEDVKNSLCFNFGLLTNLSFGSLEIAKTLYEKYTNLKFNEDSVNLNYSFYLSNILSKITFRKSENLVKFYWNEVEVYSNLGNPYSILLSSNLKEIDYKLKTLQENRYLTFNELKEFVKQCLSYELVFLSKNTNSELFGKRSNSMNYEIELKFPEDGEMILSTQGSFLEIPSCKVSDLYSLKNKIQDFLDLLDLHFQAVCKPSQIPEMLEKVNKEILGYYDKGWNAISIPVEQNFKISFEETNKTLDVLSEIENELSKYCNFTRLPGLIKCDLLGCSKNNKIIFDLLYCNSAINLEYEDVIVNLYNYKTIYCMNSIKKQIKDFIVSVKEIYEVINNVKCPEIVLAYEEIKRILKSKFNYSYINTLSPDGFDIHQFRNLANSKDIFGVMVNYETKQISFECCSKDICEILYSEGVKPNFSYDYLTQQLSHCLRRFEKPTKNKPNLVVLGINNLREMKQSKRNETIFNYSFDNLMKDTRDYLKLLNFLEGTNPNSFAFLRQTNNVSYGFELILENGFLLLKTNESFIQLATTKQILYSLEIVKKEIDIFLSQLDLYYEEFHRPSEIKEMLEQLQQEDFLESVASDIKRELNFYGKLEKHSRSGNHSVYSRKGVDFDLKVDQNKKSIYLHCDGVKAILIDGFNDEYNLDFGLVKGTIKDFFKKVDECCEDITSHYHESLENSFQKSLEYLKKIPNFVCELDLSSVESKTLTLFYSSTHTLGLNFRVDLVYSKNSVFLKYGNFTQNMNSYIEKDIESFLNKINDLVLENWVYCKELECFDDISSAYVAISNHLKKFAVEYSLTTPPNNKIENHIFKRLKHNSLYSYDFILTRNNKDNTIALHFENSFVGLYSDKKPFKGLKEVDEFIENIDNKIFKDISCYRNLDENIEHTNTISHFDNVSKTLPPLYKCVEDIFKDCEYDVLIDDYSEDFINFKKEGKILTIVKGNQIYADIMIFENKENFQITLEPRSVVKEDMKLKVNSVFDLYFTKHNSLNRISDIIYSLFKSSII